MIYIKKLKTKLILIVYIFCSLITNPSFANNIPQKFNQIIGTQAINPLYGCKDQCSVVEGARSILALGSKIIKIKTSDPKTVDAILNMPFDTYFFWWRSTSDTWFHGFSDQARQEEYNTTYQFAKKLLTQFKDSEKTFFIGHWEGDWYLLQKNGKKTTEPKQINANNMAAWLNVRQQAINDARRDFPSKAKIYHYAEVNQVVDAIKDNNKVRMVNAVLPQTNVDFVSYSSYDVQKKSEAEIFKTLDHIEAQLKQKPFIQGHRVFIGEMGMQAKIYGYDQEEHEQENRAIILKFLKWKPPYILYWQIYNNEINEDGKQEGFWLIDTQNKKWPLWYTLNNLFKAQENEVIKSGNTSYDFIWQKTMEQLERPI